MILVAILGEHMIERGSHSEFFCLRPTPFGDVAVLWSVYKGEPKATRILLSNPGTSTARTLKEFFPDLRDSSCKEIDALAGRIDAFLNGEDILFSLDAVRFDLCSAFQQKVLRAEHAIPRGRVSTYRFIAKHLGNGNGARAVGTALAHNPFPLVIPCHRAVCSDRSLGGYQGGLEMKRILLEKEGILFDNAGRVVCERFYYDRNNLDA
jgi:methylated-DNA-[protein]-cysteine S-methyltransferase